MTYAAKRCPTTKKRLRIYVSALIYVFALGIAAVDAAAFGVDAHEHHGQPCKVQYYQELAGHALQAGSSEVSAVVLYAETLVARDHVLVSATPRRPYASRAPPSLNQV